MALLSTFGGGVQRGLTPWALPSKLHFAFHLIVNNGGRSEGNEKAPEGAHESSRKSDL